MKDSDERESHVTHNVSEIGAKLDLRQNSYKSCMEVLHKTMRLRTVLEISKLHSVAL